MNLETWREQQNKDLMRWAAALNELPQPADVKPIGIKEYPAAIEKSEKLKQICSLKAKELEDQIQTIEDEYMETIESETIVIKRGTLASLPVQRKRFSSADKRERELRRRLAEHDTYSDLKEELGVWKTMVSDWRQHASRLHREFRLKEVEWQSNGGSGTNI